MQVWYSTVTNNDGSFSPAIKVLKEGNTIVTWATDTFTGTEDKMTAVAKTHVNRLERVMEEALKRTLLEGQYKQWKPTARGD